MSAQSKELADDLQYLAVKQHQPGEKAGNMKPADENDVRFYSGCGFKFARDFRRWKMTGHLNTSTSNGVQEK